MEHIVNIALLFLLSIVGSGLGILPLLPYRSAFVSHGEFLLAAFGLGFGVLSYSAFFLGVSQVLSPKLLKAGVAAYGILSMYGWIQLFKMWKKSFHPTAERKGILAIDPFPAYIRFLFFGILSFFLIICFMITLTPAYGNDALTYHLAVPNLYLKHGGISYIEGNIFAEYPGFTEMLYLIGLALRGDILAKGIHFLMALFVLGAMVLFLKEHVGEGSGTFYLSLLVFFTIPSVFINSHLAYSDLTLAFYALISVYSLLNWYQRGHILWLILCAIFTGICVATKYNALLYPMLGTLGIFYISHRIGMNYRRALGSVALFLGVCTLVASPHYVKSWVLTGNPLYPFFYEIFGGKGWSIEQSRYYGYFLANLGLGHSLRDYLLLPWNLSFHAEMKSPIFDGIIGPMFFLALPLGLFVRKVPESLKIAMVCSIFLFAFWSFSAQQIRYLIPIFPLLSIFIGFLVSRCLKRKGILLILATVVVGYSLIANGIHILKDFNSVKPHNYLLGREDRHSFLDRVIPSYGIFRHINDQLSPDAKLLLIYMKNYGFLCDRDYYSDSMFESYTLEKMIERSQTLDDLYLALKQRGFTHVVYDVNYVFGNVATMSDNQKRFFLSFQRRFLDIIKIEKRRYYLYELI